MRLLALKPSFFSTRRVHAPPDRPRTTLFDRRSGDWPMNASRRPLLQTRRRFELRSSRSGPVRCQAPSWEVTRSAVVARALGEAKGEGVLVEGDEAMRDLLLVAEGRLAGDDPVASHRASGDRGREVAERCHTWAGVRTLACGMLSRMTIEQLVFAIRSLPVPERLRVIELATHDVATDVARELPDTVETTSVTGVTLIDRHGFLVAHGESGAVLPEEVFDHRVDREARAKHLSGGS